MRAFLLLIVLTPVSLMAQNDQWGNWLMYFGANKVSDKISIHTEVQFRNHTIIPTNTEQLLLRTGINYHINDHSIATGGYAFVASHDFESPQKEAESTEHRIFEQFILTNTVGRVKFEHRYRLEQRWVNSNYRNRFRYRLMLFIPLNKSKMEPGALFVGLYDEIFMNAKATFFDRNRLYGALGYQFNKATNLQVGVMQQQVGSAGKRYLQFGLTFNPDFTN